MKALRILTLNNNLLTEIAPSIYDVLGLERLEVAQNKIKFLSG